MSACMSVNTTNVHWQKHIKVSQESLYNEILYNKIKISDSLKFNIT
jgi:hypothetical protein